MPHIGAAIAVIRSHSEQIRGKSSAVPIAARFVQSVSPCIAQNVGHSVPWPLRQRGLKALIVTEILVRDIIDVRQIWELVKVRSSHILARGAAGSGTRELSRRVRCIA